jgi:hypothetical protein
MLLSPRFSLLKPTIVALVAVLAALEVCEDVAGLIW